MPAKYRRNISVSVVLSCWCEISATCKCFYEKFKDQSNCRKNLSMVATLNQTFGALIFSACIYALIEFDFCAAIKVPCILGSVLSSCLFLNSFLGCCGALRHSVRLTWIYSIVMILLMATQIAVIFFQPIDFNTVATEIIDKVWNITDIENDYLMTSYEIKYQCCGKFGPNDYKLSNTTIPASCYYQYNPSNETVLYQDGCITKLTEMYSLNQHIEEISDWTLVGLEGTTALVAGMLAITFKNVQRRKYYH